MLTENWPIKRQGIMKLVVANGTLYDPKNGVEGEVRDIGIENGVIVSGISDPDRVIDAMGLVVMPGGIDIHAHVATYGLNWARYLFGFPTPREIGRAYALMGYTHVHEPFMTLITAGYVHHELSSIPIVDTSVSLVVNLRDLETRLKSSDNRIAVERALSLLLFWTHGLTIKLYEPFVRYDDEIYAFRNIDDQRVLSFFSTPGERLLSRIFLHTYPAILDREVSTPERFHFCHMGSALDRDTRSEKAAALLEKGATGDMGLFGPEGTLKVALCGPGTRGKDIRLNLGFYRPLCVGKADYPEDGVEDRALSLALSHPRQLAFSTDMPNHGGLGSYPTLFESLMNKRVRRRGEEMETSNQEYSIQDFVRVTRQIPAQILNLTEKGHLGDGAVGDIAIYDLRYGSKDLASRLASCAYLIKAGEVVVDRFKIVREDMEKSSYYSGREEDDQGLAREICRSTSLRFENLRVDEMFTGKAMYVAP